VRNGPWEPNVKAMRILWQDVAGRLAVDSRRVYAAGFSGGARFSFAMGPILGRSLAGVIACGAGLPEWLKLEQLGQTAFYGIVGLYDFNYKELSALHEQLAAAGKSCHVETFDGPHAWPSSALLGQALTWMEIQAMKSGLRAPDEGWLNQQYTAIEQQAQALEGQGNVPAALSLYRVLSRDFPDRPQTAESAKKVAALEVSPAWRDFRNKERQAADRELDLLNAIIRPYLQIPSALNDAFQLKRLVSALKIESLLADSTKKKAEPAGIAAARVLTDLRIKIYNDAMQRLQQKDYSTSAFYMELAAKVEPDNWRIAYDLACVHLRGGNKKKALQALDEAMARGFADAQFIAQDPDWDPLRNDKDFLGRLERMKEKAAAEAKQ